MHRVHIGIVYQDQMKSLQKKVQDLVKQGKSLEEIKGEFEENQRRLVESIYNEINAG